METPEKEDRDDLLKLGFEGEQALTAELFLKYGKTYEPRQIIIREGEVGREVYLIISGRVVVTERLERGSYKVLNSLGPGEIFGEMALVDNMSRSATLISAAPTKLLSLRKEDFETIFRSHPRWAFRILGALGKRILSAFKHVETHFAKK
ncbi:MAG: cyclic nucleotide-binding domain-containing protein [Spirochaetales bacterium]|nr:cyclic nucleotide-binding domain-containing protein [Leptospiraceae bacterium]MCP5480673.1 cyclic nucleotide-binding domain-containing protein [Spirochaetales bacterium]MCP5484025.1 cyclic nucleotide-binding domain-containing protein [Spirochaetales bacterium]